MNQSLAKPQVQCPGLGQSSPSFAPFRDDDIKPALDCAELSEKPCSALVPGERESMARTFSLASVLLSVPLVAGCATGALFSSDQPPARLYRESAADVVNRAPLSMSVPQESSETPLLDPVYLRTQADYHFALAESYGLAGNGARAIEEYKLTLVYDPKSAVVRLRLASEYLKQGLMSESIAQAKIALEIDSRNEEAHMLLGGLYSALRMYDEASKSYAEVIRNNPNNFEARLFVGAIQAEQKKYPQATETFEKLAKAADNGNAHLAWYYLGRVLLEEDRERNRARAETSYRNAIRERPQYFEAILALGQLLQDFGRRADTLRLYKNYQESHGPNVAVAEELARLYIEDRDYKSAFDQLSVLEASDPMDLTSKAKMAFILIEQKQYAEAIVRLEEILALEPASDKIRFYLGAVYEEIKDFSAAIKQFEKIQVESSYYHEAVVHASYLYKLSGDYSSALRAVQEGIKNADDKPQFYTLYASLLDDQKKYQEALELLNRAVSRFPEHTQLQFYLGSIQDKTGDKEGSISSMQKVLRIDADHVQALNYLAYTYADLGKNLDEAESMVRRALALQPNDGYIMDTLGWVLFRRGRTEEAVRFLEAAYKLEPNESIIAEHLGDAYYHLQMPEKARKLYLRAAETETNVANLEKIREKLASIDHQKQTLETKLESKGLKGRQPASAKQNK